MPILLVLFVRNMFRMQIQALRSKNERINAIVGKRIAFPIFFIDFFIIFIRMAIYVSRFFMEMKQISGTCFDKNNQYFSELFIMIFI
jgi:hypothetical protein